MQNARKRGGNWTSPSNERRDPWIIGTGLVSLVLFLFALFTMALSSKAGRSTFQVPGDYDTIQSALDAAAPGDTVAVAAGVYHENVYMRDGVILLGTRGHSSTPADSTDDTIIDSQESGRPVTFYSTAYAALIGCTIINGRGSISGGNIYCSGFENVIRDNLIAAGETSGAWGGYGGGIFDDGERTTIAGNTIRDCWAWHGGGGIRITSDAHGCLVEDNVIRNCQADWGGGIYSEGPLSATIRGNVIDDCYADHRHGGGIRAASGGELIIEANTLVFNRAKEWGYGGAFYLTGAEDTHIRVRSNIAAWNWNSNRTGGIYFTGAGTIELCCNDVFENTGYQYHGCSPDSCSFELDPLFVDTDAGDYRLQEDSPCIDATSTDCGGSCDPDLTLADLGAYHFPQAGAVPPEPFDLSIAVSDLTIQLSWEYEEWDCVPPFVVQSSSSPWSGFSEEEGGTFNGSTWIGDRVQGKHFYRVVTVAE